MSATPEAASNAAMSAIAAAIPTIQANAGGASSQPASVPKMDDEPKPQPAAPDAITTGTKTDTETAMQKGKDSKQLPIPSNISPSTTAAPSASESTTTTDTSVKQGFTNMFGSEYASF
jgi:hypothetical protein